MRVLTLGVAMVVAAASMAALAAFSSTNTGAGTAMLVELRPATACDAPALVRDAGGTLVSSALRLYRIEGRAAPAVLQGIRACGALRLATEDRLAGTLSTTDFSDPLMTTEWWRAAIGISGLTPPGVGRAITIVDSGVDVAHPDLVARPNLVTLNPQEPQPIGGVHGTAVASLIGATQNGVGIVGIYPDALLQSWDAALGAGTQLATSDIVAGVLAAAKTGPGVINLSLGSSGSEIVIQQAIETAIRKGMLVVAAAGNDGEAGNLLSYPASLPHVLTAAATDEQNQPAVFSSRSRYVDIAAPGQNITVATAFDDSWASEDGTSFSSPLVAGAAAWVWALRPDLDASQLFEVMRRSATDIDTPGRDDATGYGLLNVPAALAYAAPVKDPLEPNDDIDYVTPGRTYYTGIPALTTRAKRSATLVARLTNVEDPRDVFRVFVPARSSITVKTTVAAGVDLALWSSSATSVTAGSAGTNRLARGVTAGASESVTYRNAGVAKTVYLAVTPGAGTRDATYRIAVSAR